MSGSGSGGDAETWRPKSRVPERSDTNTEDEADRCAIVESTVLNSPVQNVISGLKAGDQLSVVLETQPRQRVVAKDQSGQIAGAITSARLVEIIECLGEGYTYKAIVKAVSSGRVEIEISPAA